MNTALLMASALAGGLAYWRKSYLIAAFSILCLLGGIFLS
jgi:hypothetical protein